MPTRIHQQVRKLGEEFGEENVTPDIIEKLDEVTTEKSKNAEKDALQDYYDLHNQIPKGNQKSFKPKKK